MLYRFFLSASIAAAAFAAPVEAASRCGTASYYGQGDGFAWRTMANGRPMNPAAMTTAHPSLPFGTRVQVSNQANGKSVVVVVTDRGPYHGGRVLDLSPSAFAHVASLGQGIASVCYRIV